MKRFSSAPTAGPPIPGVSGSVTSNLINVFLNEETTADEVSATWSEALLLVLEFYRF